MTLPAVLQQPLTLPVIASPLFLASGPELVLAQCQAGVVGSFPALNARPAELLSDVAESGHGYHDCEASKDALLPVPLLQ